MGRGWMVGGYYREVGGWMVVGAWVGRLVDV